MSWLSDYFKGKQPNKRQNQLDQIEQNDNVGKPAPKPVLQNPESQQQLKDSLQNAFGTPKTSMNEPQQSEIDPETLAQLLALRNLNRKDS